MSHLPGEDVLLGNTKSLFQFLERCQSDHTSALPGKRIGPAELLSCLSGNRQASGGTTQPEISSTTLKDFLTSQLPEYQLQPQFKVRLTFVDQIFTDLYENSQPNASLIPALSEFTRLLSCQLLGRPDLLILSDHPLSGLVGQLFAYAAIWSPLPGRAGREFPEWLVTSSQRLAKMDINAQQQLALLHRELQQLIHRHRHQADKITQKLIAVEERDQSITQARDSVVTFLDRRLDGAYLPTVVADFVSQQLPTELQSLILREGINCNQWKKWQRLVQVLSWAFSPDTHNGQQHKVQKLLVPMMEKMDESYWQGFNESHRFEAFFQDLQNLFFQVIQGQSITTHIYQAQESSATQQKIRIDDSMINALDEDSEGKWYTIAPGEGSPIRQDKAQMALKDQRLNRILLVNSNGRKKGSFTFDEFALARASHILKPYDTGALLRNALETTLKIMAQNCFDRAEQARQTETRSNDRPDAVRPATNKEGESHRDEVVDPEPSLRQAPDDQQLESCLSRIQALQTGAWLCWHRDTSDQDMKLSVKLNRADKYIFTDRLGQPLAEFASTELSRMLSTKEISIIREGDRFENSLETIVKGLRKKTL